MSGKPIEKLARKPPVEFTAARKLQYLTLLRTSGLRALSAEQTGVSSTAVLDHMKRDTVFAEEVREAEQAFIDDVLVREATRRAVKGVKRPIIGGKFKDEVVAHERVFSDGLLLALLRSKRKEFRDGVDESAEAAAGAAGAFAVPTTPLSRDEWVAKYMKAAKGVRS